LLTDSPPARIEAGKVGLVRGVLKRLDPIHDQLLIHSFGGGDVRIAFDPRTQLLAENTSRGWIGLPVGSVVSVDTVINDGKLFARSVRTGAFNPVELNGQVVRYDPAKFLLTVRDPMSPKNVALRITPGTTVVKQGKPVAVETLSPGMLVQVWFSPAQNASKHGADSTGSDMANRIEILAERGNSFVFAGRIVAVDLRSGVLALSNDTDQSVRELAISSLDSNSRSLLREGTDVTIHAEFDGERYNVRAVTVLSHTP
jgi:outer membrane protein assembly factor BamB